MQAINIIKAINNHLEKQNLKSEGYPGRGRYCSQDETIPQLREEAEYLVLQSHLSYVSGMVLGAEEADKNKKQEI